MYIGGITFSINKSFGSLQLVPESKGLRFVYTPVVNGIEDENAIGFANIMLPLDAVGGIWATARAFLYAVESLDENIILQGRNGNENSDILIKLYRDKPRGENGRLKGEETCWLKIVAGKGEEERRRIKLGPRDLLCLELACNTVMTLASTTGRHNPKPFTSQS